MAIFVAPKLDSVEEQVVDSISGLKDDLAFRMQTQRWSGALRRNTAARALRGSLAIEGFKVSVEDAIAAIADGDSEEMSESNRDALIGYQRAMTLVLRRSDDPNFVYSSEFLNALHFIMVEKDARSRPGCWRVSPVVVYDEASGEVVYDAPGAEELPLLIGELVEWLNSSGESHPLVRGAMAHLNLVMIHPYKDGNGRMARCLQTLLLMKEWNSQHPQFTSIEEYLGRNSAEYYKALAQVGTGSWSPKSDCKPWIRFMLTAHYRQAVTVMNRTKYYNEIHNLAESLIEKHGLPERTTLAVGESLTQTRISNSDYRSLAGVSKGTASRDLAALVKAGLLAARGEARGRQYVASAELRQQASKFAKPGKVPDPFELEGRNSPA